ncbi:hypothetical protein HS088_TW20G00654 [Tripterygium wilfordii]|uniref:DUF4220 domain-containing protein n=2 Tax=Tripterygium wilfordii TaxID=458696 RepID=A0A7J7C813_TRIWF|nr:hypothetical protein HS088_TW20G00654 [Tripterygium wilfordii]
MLQFFIWIAYVLSTFLISYTIGMMLSASFHNGLFPIWAVLLCIVLGGTASISAYSIGDNESQKKFNFDILVRAFSVMWFLVMKGSEVFTFPLYLFLILTAIKTWERSRALRSASKMDGLAKETKLIADFMNYEHKLRKAGEVLDPTSMAGYKYLVRGEDENNVKVVPPLYQKRLEITEEVITIEKIWQCKGQLLCSGTGDPDGQLKDICLSFALCKLFCCRFAGYTLLERSQEKLTLLTRSGLLAYGSDYERPFRVIEVELAFLQDFLYTKYPIIFRRGLPIYKIIELIIFMVGCCVATSELKNYQAPDGYLSLHTGAGWRIDVVVTTAMIWVIFLTEIMELLFILFSNWTKMTLISDYVRKPAWQKNKFVEKVIEFICNRQWLSPWGRVLGQYSLLESFDHNPSKFLYNSFTAAFMDIPCNGQKERTPIKLPVEVKQQVSHTLNLTGRRVANGFTSLNRNGVAHKLGWACKLESPVHVIMVWHIATTLCEIDSSIGANPEVQREKDFVVAASLSKYCAYLVGFCPRLLPVHAYSAKFIFDQVVCEAREDLNGCYSMKSRYDEMILLAERDPEESTIMRRGAVLGKRLMEIIEDSPQRWKILAEFWAELMLFLAISGDETAHAEHLVKGGEFVTHLWVLLQHAGVLEQETAEQDV